MITTEQQQSFKELLDVTETIVVCFAKKPTQDQVATALGLSLALTEAGKQVQLVSSYIIPKNLMRMPGAQTLQNTLGKQNLTISFPYNKKAVDKVSYHIGEESKRFYLTVRPQKGQEPLDSSKVEYSYTGASADLLILVGVSQFEELGELYFGYEEFFASASSVIIHTFSPEIGGLKLDVSGVSCMSEAAANLLTSSEVALSGDAATTFLYGVEHSTQHFSSLTTSPETFELVARLLRIGARRLKMGAKKVERKSLLKVQRRLGPQSQEVTLKPGKANPLLLSQDKKEDTPLQQKVQLRKTKKQHIHRGKNQQRNRPGSLGYQPEMGVGKT